MQIDHVALKKGTPMKSIVLMKGAAAILAGLAAGWTLWAVASGPSSVAEGPRSTAVDCGNASTQSEMNECALEEAKRSRAVLDALLKELAGTLDSAQVEGLKKVQRLWEDYRESHCRWQAAFSEGGSIQPMIHATCIDELTAARISELAINLCEGNGMTGECDASRRYRQPAAD